MKRVCLLARVFPPQTGGSGRWLWEVYRRMPAGAVAVAADDFAGADDFDHTHHLRIERLPLDWPSWGIATLAGWRNYRAARRAVGRLVSAHGANSQLPTAHGGIAIHCGCCLPEGFIAWMLKQTRGIPYVCYVHGEEMNYTGSSRELTWMVRRVLAGADYLIANSRNTLRILTDDWHVPPARVRLLHPGVDTGKFCPAERDESIRRRLGWGAASGNNAQRPVVLTAGRLQRRKGQDQMIRAVDIIRRSVPDVLYAIVGDGDDRARLEGLVDELDLRRHVQFQGECDDQTLVDCYQQCDLFVLANRQEGRDIEGFGMVLLEAQACARPVIAGDSGGTAETMQVGRTGLIVDCRGPQPLADTVAGLLADADRRAAMGAAAREWVVGHFDWQALAAQAAAMFGMELPIEELATTRPPSVGFPT
jgi:phosphatidylinositol alpha-1,6-mannosyltransferase